MKSMNKIKELWDENPLKLIIWIAIILRVIAAIFSKGFGMHDDHFLVIEASQSWVDGTDYNNWLPGSNGNTSPTGHSFFYVGLHFLIFTFLEWLQIFDAQTKMYIIRFLHAAYSLITVVLAYRIALRLYNIKAARMAGLLIAVLWIMPFLSVRNLVEVVCIPPMLYAIWLILKSKDKDRFLYLFFWSGFFLGLAFSIRFQTLLFSGGVGLALLLDKKWRETIILGTGLLFSIFLIQGVTDIIIWGYPFAELMEYVRYNYTHANDYIVLGWYNYILLILGLLIPPVSFYLVFGFLRTWKKHLIVFLPTLLFLVFHSAFPNKQERFILPIIPFIITLGCVGWYEFLSVSYFWKRNKRLLKASWIFFWVLNIIFLPFVTTMYSKKARVESMTYLSKYDNIEYIVLENTNRAEAKMSPRFYLEEWVSERQICQNVPLQWHIDNHGLKGEHAPSFVLFFEETNIDNRVKAVKEVMPSLVFEAKIQPSFVDKVVHWLNPVNANEVIYIYRNTEKIPNALP